ncbi:hypothetical protein SNE40_013022 [Patella caerulea]|uniref:DUF4371 domain-containing protein n=1 Tax=Patella caerulea TaxID=87958 RepID=A0AAN8PGD5_PATCE
MRQSFSRKCSPDSKIAQEYSSGRTKTSCVINELAEDSKFKIVSIIQEDPFSLATDGSTDYDDVKLYPVCVQYFNSDTGHVVSELLSLTECTMASTGQNIFELMNTELKSCEIPWKNVVSFSTDNAFMMVGALKGVASFILKENLSGFINGCLCHLMHLAASKAANCLNCDVKSLLIDIYYYLEKSSKRKQTLKSYQEQFSLPNRKIIKHVATRWLSLGKCLTRLSEQRSAFTAFLSTAFRNRCRPR